MPTIAEIKREAQIRIAIAKSGLVATGSTINKARALRSHPNQQVQDAAVSFLAHARSKAVDLIAQIDAP